MPSSGSLARVHNICFHGIGRPGRSLEPGEEPYWISVDAYLRILDSITPRRDVAISFDDGNASDVEIALPALLERGLVASFFPLAGRLDRPGSLTAADLRTLRRHGMAIGSHGMDHTPWRGLSERQRRVELVLGRERLVEASGGPVGAAALPLGRYDRRLLGQLRRLGYSRVYSSDRAPASPKSWLQPRFSVRNDTSPEVFLREVFGALPPARRLRARAVRLAKRLR